MQEFRGNTDKFEMIATTYDTPERVHTAKVASDVIREYVVDAKSILDVELVLSRLFDVLNEGGHLLIVDFDNNDKVVSELVHNGFHQDELTDIMMELGYSNIHSKTFYSGSKLFVGQDATMFVLAAQK